MSYLFSKILEKTVKIMVSLVDSTMVSGALLGAFRGFRSVLENDYLPVAVGDKFNVAEGIGALCYQPCIYSLSKAIRVLEKDEKCSWVQVSERVSAVAMVVFTSVAVAVGFVIKRIGEVLPHDKTPRTEEVYEKTAPEKIDQIYELIREFSVAADEIGVDYRMVSGTALGAIRHGGIIPWDDDGDFGILEAERAKVDRAIAEGVFLKHGLDVRFYPGMENYQITYIEEKRAGAVVAALDLFLMKRVQSCGPQDPIRIAYSSDFLTEHFPHDYFTEAEWNAVAEWHFGPKQEIRLKGPDMSSTGAYVKRAYGDDCLTCGVKTHKHAGISLFGFKFSALGIPVVTREKVLLANLSPATGLKWRL